MKTISSVLLLMLLAACTSEKEEAILAKGQAFRLIRTDYYGSPANPALVRSTRYEYNQNNLIYEVVTYNTAGALDSKIVYRWLNGTTLRIEQHYTNPPWSSSFQSGLPLKMYAYSETVYNSDSTWHERKNYTIQNDKTEYRSVTRFEYDSQKRMVRRNIYGADNKLASYTVYEYDSRGNVSKESYYPNTTGPNYTNTYEYDKAPNPYRPVRLDAEISWYMSANNIVRQQAVNLVSGTNSDDRWKYEYRSDGYPARIIYADGRREEFMYNVP